MPFFLRNNLFTILSNNMECTYRTDRGSSTAGTRRCTVRSGRSGGGSRPTMGLELLEAIRIYLSEHVIRLQVVFEIALITVGTPGGHANLLTNR